MACIRRSVALVAGLFLSGLVSGCGNGNNQDHLAGRFAGRHGEPNSAAAMELTERYTQLVQTVGTLRQQNQQLAEENTRLKAQVEDLQAKLTQAQAELGDANTLLMEMLGELNKWKADVLGFRNEMREASKAQLEALMRILEAMGAQPAGPDQQKGEGGGAGQ